MNLYWWYPGGRLHTTANTCPPAGVGSGAIGTVSSQFVKDPHKCTCSRGTEWITMRCQSSGYAVPASAAAAANYVVSDRA
jgi:hypothetical protein